MVRPFRRRSRHDFCKRAGGEGTVDGADARAFTAPAARALRADRGADRLRDKRRRRRGARGWQSR